MKETNDPPEWKLITRYDVIEYKCGLKQGDLLRLKRDLPVRRQSDDSLTGEVHRANEVWTVLSGSEEDPVVFLLQPDGKRHTWIDDPAIFDFFERVGTSAT